MTLFSAFFTSLSFSPLPSKVWKTIFFVFVLSGEGLLRLLGQNTPSITAEAVPSDPTLAETVDLVITIKNDPQAQVSPPVIGGLTQVMEQDQISYEVVNGSTQSTMTKHIFYRPRRSGTILIGPISVSGGPFSLVSSPITLQVQADPDSPSPPPSNSPGVTSTSSSPVVLPVPVAPASQSSPPLDSSVDLVNSSSGPPVDFSNGDYNYVPLDADGNLPQTFMTVTLSDEPHTYVGQILPIVIRCYIRMDVLTEQDSLPVLKGGDFLMNSLSTRPLQYQAAVGNSSYEVDSWTTSISPLHAGNYTLQLFRETNAAAPSSNPFDNPFTRPPVTRTSVASNAVPFRVVSLPPENRPPEFTGAIGEFQASVTSQPDRVTVGQPVLIRFTIDGKGNFDRVNCPSLASDPNWKTYPARSTLRFVEESHIEGTKVFQLSAIPKVSGLLHLPDSSFSYFDPNSKAYRTIPLPLGPVTVTPPLQDSLTSSPGTSPPLASLNPAQAVEPNLLSPNYLVLNRPLRPAEAVASRKALDWFWPQVIGFTSATLLCLVGIIAYRRYRPWWQDRQRDQALRRDLAQKFEAAFLAADRGDRRTFFLSARTALQEALGKRLKTEPTALTSRDIDMKAFPWAAEITPFFKEIDQISYSGTTGRAWPNPRIERQSTPSSSESEELLLWKKRLLELQRVLVN